MSRRNHKRKGSFLTTLFILAIIVLLGADNFGFDWFNFGFDLNNVINQSESDSEEKPTKPENKITTSENQYINIVVKEDTLTLNEDEITFDDLKASLEQFSTDITTVNLMDDGAYIGPFEEVENYLKDTGYKIIISDTVR